MAQNGSLSPAQERSIIALLTQRDVANAALHAKVAPRTLFRWLHDNPEFIRAYRTARREVVQHATTCLQQTAAAAVQTLQKVMNDPLTPASAKVSAARTVLEMAYRATETEDILARLEALEEAQAGEQE